MKFYYPVELIDGRIQATFGYYSKRKNAENKINEIIAHNTVYKKIDDYVYLIRKLQFGNRDIDIIVKIIEGNIDDI